MTIIDTTLYADGALRLSRHGAGRGDTVLLRTWDSKQITIQDADTSAAQQLIAAEENVVDPVDIFHHVRDAFGRY